MNMPAIQISVPSKTFLLGEYLALEGGPALLLTTQPRFSLIATQSEHNNNIAWASKESPAGRLIETYSNFYQQYSLGFIDPHEGRGGFGASSAQFIMLYALRQQLYKKKINLADLIKTYKKLAWIKKGITPSGVDLIAQLHGNICFFHSTNHQLEIFSWPFVDLDYCLIHTGNKLATHQHLQQLVNLNVIGLEKIVLNALKYLQQKNSKQFLDTIYQYATTLQEKNLVATHTQKILKQLSTCSDILAAKGCGALGADVIIVFFAKNNTDVITWLKKEKQYIVTHGQQLECGLQLKYIH